MDASLFLRLLPAFAVAVLVLRRERAWGDAVDEVLRVLVIGLVAGRLAWLALGGPEVWRSALTTAVLVRAGVVTGAGALAAIALRWPKGGVPTLAPVAVLAGLGAWQLGCQLEGLCGGVPVSWGVQLPGRAVPTFPAAYVEGAVALAAAAGAWRWGRGWWWVAGWLVARIAIGFGRPHLGSVLVDDRLWSVLVLAAVVALARRADAPEAASAPPSGDQL